MAATGFEFVEITDPQTSKSFYANIVTGECSWDKPKDRKVKTKNPKDDEWWELFDSNHKLPYYYNSRTGETEWLKPVTGTVIPLISIQNSSIGKRVSIAIKRASSMNTFGDFSGFGEDDAPEVPPKAKQTPSGKKSFAAAVISGGSKGTTPLTDDELRFMYNGGNVLSVADEDSVKATSVSAIPTVPQSKQQNSMNGVQQYQGTRNQQFTVSDPNNAQQGPAFQHQQLHLLHQHQQHQNLVPNVQKNPNLQNISGPSPNVDAANAMSPLNPANQAQGHQKGARSRISLPADLKNQIERFQMDGFAKKYFGEHRRGIFRRKVPVKDMLKFQKDALKAPLILLNKEQHKEALKCFKLVQKVMGDRSSKEENTQDLKTLVNIGILRGELRDEIYMQVCKQLTENPNKGIYGNSSFRGWQMLCVLANAFPPSKNLEQYLKSFICRRFNSTESMKSSSIPRGTLNPLDKLARHLEKKINKICDVGPRGKPLTDAEIERAMEAPFRVSVFGETLAEIMRSQIEDDQANGRPLQPIPRILPFLTDAIIRLGGNHSEGIFRVPGDSDDVTMLRCRIEKGNYSLKGITDPNTPSSLLKLWMRELDEPLLPVNVYDECIRLGADTTIRGDEYKRAMGILSKLPEINRNVALYIISFLKTFRDPESVKATKMSPTNVAMVFAPNFLRCPSDNMTVIFENTKFEQSFLRTLLIEKKI